MKWEDEQQCREAGRLPGPAMASGIHAVRKRQKKADETVSSYAALFPGKPITEQTDLICRFTTELWKGTRDGAKKRERGEKDPWFIESVDSHHAGAMRHYARWLTDPEGRDEHSGAHHLVAAAWRLLAIACRESGNVPKEEK